MVDCVSIHRIKSWVLIMRLFAACMRRVQRAKGGCCWKDMVTIWPGPSFQVGALPGLPPQRAVDDGALANAVVVFWR
jgi:hypothetical protein